MGTATIEPYRNNTQLDPLETYPGRRTDGRWTYDTDLPSTYHAFRHSGWKHYRERTRRAFKAAFIRPNQTLAFESCGSQATLHQSVTDPNKYQLRSNKCKSRWCIPCAGERGRSMAATLADIVGTKQVRFITLTIRTREESLQESLDHLTKSFARLRHSKLWKQTQTGGAAFTEVKWNPDKQRWHPHIHIVGEGRFIDKKLLSNAWTRASKGSFIVDVRLVHSRPDLCSYITKYVTKPVSGSVYRDDDRLAEAIVAMKGRRICTTYGTWRGTVLHHKPEADEWRYVSTYEQARERAITNPLCRESLALKALTRPRTPDQWKENHHGPPNENQTDLFCDYREESIATM